MHLGFNCMNTAADPSAERLARTLEEAGCESLWYGGHSPVPVARITPCPAGGAAFRARGDGCFNELLALSEQEAP